MKPCMLWSVDVYYIYTYNNHLNVIIYILNEFIEHKY